MAANRKYGLPDGHGEEFMIRVSWSTSPDHRIRRGEIMADVGLPPPDPPLTNAEMQDVTFATKMAVLKALRLRRERCGVCAKMMPKGGNWVLEPVGKGLSPERCCPRCRRAR